MFSLDATLIAELVLFGLVLAIMAKVVLPPLRRAMDSRQVTIQAGLASADAAKSRSIAVDLDCQRRLAQARREGQEILATYQAMGRQAEQDLRANAKREADRIVANARVRAKAR